MWYFDLIYYVCVNRWEMLIIVDVKLVIGNVFYKKNLFNIRLYL